MNITTKMVSEYIRNKGFNLAKLSRDTGIPYMALYNSLFDEKQKRDLRDWEFLRICSFIGKDPRDFNDKNNKESA